MVNVETKVLKRQLKSDIKYSHFTTKTQNCSIEIVLNDIFSKNQKRLAEKFWFIFKLLKFLPLLQGKVVSSLPSDIWASRSNSTPWTWAPLPRPSFSERPSEYQASWQILLRRWKKWTISYKEFKSKLIKIQSKSHTTGKRNLSCQKLRTLPPMYTLKNKNPHSLMPWYRGPYLITDRPSNSTI